MNSPEQMPSTSETDSQVDTNGRATTHGRGNQGSGDSGPGLLHLDGVKRHYFLGGETVRALDGVTLDIAAGEYLAIMGKSGSGKSTLMNIIGCLDTPTAGRYQLAANAVETMDDDQLAQLRNKVLGFVFQSFNLLPRLDAVDNVALPLLYRNDAQHLNPEDRRKRALKALVRVGLADRADHLPNQLSGGQRQRVAIARALVNQPQVLLADEPTGNLDSRTTHEIVELINELAASGTTVILVTHEDDIAANAKRVVELKDGRVLKDEG